MTTRTITPERIELRSFEPEHLPDFVAFWNQAFSARRGFLELTETLFHRRLLKCPAFDPAGLTIAWHRNSADIEQMVGLVHAFRPPPDTPTYRRWGRHHTIAVLYVEPAFRYQGIGGRLLKAAEDWLYYCPVHFGDQSTPCYGNVEGPQQPLFGSSQRMGINARDSELLQFLSKRGYKVVDPGDVSMTVELGHHKRSERRSSSHKRGSLRMLRVDNMSPFTGNEPAGRSEHTIWGRDSEDPYSALVLVDDSNTMRGHLTWYRFQDISGEQSAAIYGFWLDPAWRGLGYGSLLLDTALDDMEGAMPSNLRLRQVEVQTHVVRHSDAVALYESRGFQIDDVWVTLVKT
jgi:GNAT superfamily N-acetyltransferase